MKKLLILTGAFGLGMSLLSCGGARGTDPGEVYMPDMAYSRAYEAYGYNNNPEDHDLKSRGAYYNGLPVAGTVARGDMLSYQLTADSAGLTKAQSLRNPLDSLGTTKAQLTEAERIYLIHCGICHGTKLDGNGPLWKDGNGPYPAAPRPLNAEYAKALTDGHYFHVITYGKGQMGSYASQLSPEERWWVIKYIRSKQGMAGGDSTKTTVSGNAMATTDSTTKK